MGTKMNGGQVIVNKMSIATTAVVMSLMLPALASAGFSAEDGALDQVRRLPREVQSTAKDAAKPALVSAPSVKAATPGTKQVWVARSGTTLRKTIEEWCRIADWTPVWEPVDVDYPNSVTRTFEGSFEAVVVELFSPYRDAKRPLLVDGWRGNTALIVSEKR